MDTGEVSGFADFFVICTAGSQRQLKTIRDEIQQVLKKEGVSLLHDEGTADSGWVLLDYGDVIMHIFAPAEREQYQLEKMWDRARPVLRIQ